MDFDILLQRTLRSGKEYDALIPKTTCKSTSLGNGETDFSMRKMAEVVAKFNYQTEKVADKLERDSLALTVAAIKDFVFNHFQYKADTEIQLIRTPSCSWHQRNSGIDCKSYSIIASSILTNLGIPHAFRKIKQPGYNSTSWTHVYVVVPIATTGEYYVIDGTLPEAAEPQFTEFKDLDMRHEMLNGGVSAGMNAGLNATNWEQIYKGIGYAEQAASAGTNSGKLLDLANMRGKNFAEKLWNALKYSKSAFPASKLEQTINRIQTHYENLAIKINEATSARDYVALSKHVAEFKVCGQMMFDAYRKKQSEKNWNGETNANINTCVDALFFYQTIGVAALNAWLNEYFVAGGNNGSIKMNSVDYLGNDYLFYSFTGVPIYVETPVVSYSVKPLTYEIKAFILTRYVGELNSPSDFNASKFLGGIQQVAGSFQKPSFQNPNGQNPIINPATGQPYPPDFSPLPPLTPKEAGMNWLGMALIAGAVIYGVKEFGDDKPTKNKQANTK